MSQNRKEVAFVKVRIPPQRRQWVIERAKRNKRSMNQEFNFILECFERMEESGNVPRIA